MFVLLLLTSPFQSMPSLTVDQPAISFLGSSAITSSSRRNAWGLLQGSLNNWKTTQPGSSMPLCWTSTTTSGSPSCQEHQTPGSGEFHWQNCHWTPLAYPTVGHRRSPEVGWEMFFFMLSLTAYLSIPARQTLTCPVNLDWKSPRKTICGYSCWFCPLQWRNLPKMSLPSTTSQAMELHHRPHTGWASAPWQDISSLHPWTEGHGGVYTGGTSVHSVYWVTSVLLPHLLLWVFSSWPRRTEAWGPALITRH